jgi:DNA-binding response OmpR family regulator
MVTPMLYLAAISERAIELQAFPASSGGNRERPRFSEPLRRRGKRRVLVVDDEPTIADTLAEILKMAGFEVTVAYDALDAMDRAATSCPDVVVTDVMLPGKNGIEMAIVLRNICPQARVLLISGQTSTRALLDEARRQGYDFELMAKPVPPEELLRRLRE